jgi:hypothetical protein
MSLLSGKPHYTIPNAYRKNKTRNNKETAVEEVVRPATSSCWSKRGLSLTFIRPASLCGVTTNSHLVSEYNPTN